MYGIEINSHLLGFLSIVVGIYSVRDAYLNPEENDLLLNNFGRYFFGGGSIISGVLLLTGIWR